MSPPQDRVSRCSQWHQRTALLDVLRSRWPETPQAAAGTTSHGGTASFYGIPVASFTVGDQVLVPSVALGLVDEGPALREREVRALAGRSVVVDTQQGATTKVGVARVHQDFGLALLRVGDLETETALLNPLADSLEQYFKLLLPDDRLGVANTDSSRAQGALGSEPRRPDARRFGRSRFYDVYQVHRRLGERVRACGGSGRGIASGTAPGVLVVGVQHGLRRVQQGLLGFDVLRVHRRTLPGSPWRDCAAVRAGLLLIAARSRLKAGTRSSSGTGGVAARSSLRGVAQGKEGRAGSADRG